MNISQEEKRAKWREYYHRKHPSKPARTYYHPAMGKIVTHDHYATRIFWNQDMLQFLKKNFATMLNQDLSEWLGVSQRTVVRKARELGLEKDAAWLKSIWDERRKMAVASTKTNGNAGTFRKGCHASPATEFKKGYKRINKAVIKAL